MADTTTGLAVKSLSGEFVRAKLVDTGGANEAAISAAGRISVDGSGVTQPVSGTIAVSSITTSVVPGTAATNLGKAEDAGHTTGDVGVMALAVRNDAGGAIAGTDLDYIPLTTDNTGALRVTGGSAGTQYVGDAAATATPTGTLEMGLANAAAPTDVSANNDAVAAWFLRNGSQVVNIASAGTLITVGQKVMASSLPVVIASDQASIPVTVSGVATATNQTSVQVVDNAAFTDGTTTLNMSGYIFDNVAGTALTENDAAAGRINANRAQVLVGEDGTTRAQFWAINSSGALSGNVTHYGGTATTLGQKTMSASVPVVISSDQSAVSVTIAANSSVNIAQVAGTNTVTGGVAGTLAVGGVLAHDAAAAAALPVGVGFFASAAAPTDVSADGDATKGWSLRNGSQVVNIASGGTLVTLGQKVMTSSLPVTIASDQSALAVTGTFAGNLVDNAAFTDGTTTIFMQGYIFDETPGTALTENDGAAARIDSKRAVVFVGEDATTRGQRWAISAAGALAGNLTQVGGSTISATVPVPSRSTDGTAFYTKTGQTAATAAFAQLSDQTTAVNVIAGTNALKTDASSIAGAVPSATNPLPVRLTDGAAFYAALSSNPVSPQFSTKTSSALGAGASVDLTHYVTSGKTGHLMGLDIASTIAMKVVVNTELTASKTTRIVLFSLAGQPIQWRTPYKTFITQSSGNATSGFSVTITNKDAAVAADVYSTGYWDEV